VECKNKSDANNDRVTATISKSSRKYLDNESEKHDITELQKRVILGTRHILQTVLGTRHILQTVLGTRHILQTVLGTRHILQTVLM